MRENKFQSNLKKEIKETFPGCIVTKLDSGDIQGIPDLLILYKNKWATLENKYLLVRSLVVEIKDVQKQIKDLIKIIM